MTEQGNSAEGPGGLGATASGASIATELDAAGVPQDAMRRLAEMHFHAGATEVLPGVHGLPDRITADQVHLFDNAPLNGQAYSMVATHLFGTCRAGKDPAHSVVNPQLRVHDTEGLYVMDGSVFPSNTGVNPQHGIMAIAMTAARRLAAA